MRALGELERMSRSGGASISGIVNGGAAIVYSASIIISTLSSYLYGTKTSRNVGYEQVIRWNNPCREGKIIIYS